MHVLEVSSNIGSSQESDYLLRTDVAIEIFVNI